LILNFQLKKDWQSGQVSFKKGQNVNGDVQESGLQKPYNVTNPFHWIEIKDPRGTVKIPFCYIGEPILEATVAPWLCQIDLTPPPINPVVVTNDGNVVMEAKSFFGLKNIGDQTVMIVIISSVLVIMSIFIYLIIKKSKKAK